MVTESNNNIAVMAGIVTYNPDISRLSENISAIVTQVDALMIVDNGSKNVKEIGILLKSHENVSNCKIHLTTYGQNRGIAVALNEIMKFADMNSFDWCVTLDQDSISPENMVEEYMKYVDMEDVAMMSPVIVDRNSEKVIRGKYDYECIDRCITSGAMTRTEEWKSLKMAGGV